MKFDNAAFEQKVARTMSTMDKLKSKLHFDAAASGLDKIGGLLGRIGLRNPFANAAKGATDLNRAAGQVPRNLTGIEGGITHISKAWLAMATIGITAMSNLVMAAGRAGGNIASSLTLDPIKQGFGEYELKMGSITTILANTAKYGTKLSDVTKNLNELNKYSDRTIYNFGEMTKAVGLFTNAGIKLEDATSMIKGFSNEAAASGASAEQAAHAQVQLSQGISAGTIRAMDWFSLTNAGMGNSNMKDGLIDIAQAMGQFNGKTDVAKLAQKDFKGSLEKGWLSAKVMSTYLKIMSGDMSDSQIKALGLSDAMVKHFRQQQQTAAHAAQDVKTFSQLMGTVKESIGSGWAQTFEIIFGDFNEAKKLFTGVNNFIGAAVKKSANQRNKMFKEWDEMGGKTAFFDGLLNGFHALMSILGPIKQGFRDIFPAQTGKTLTTLSEHFRDFMKSLIASKSTMSNIRSIAGGFFAVLDIGWQIVKKLIGVLFTLFQSMGGGQGHILDFAGSIGDFLISLDDAIKNGGLLTGFFTGLGSVLSVPVHLLAWLADLIGSMFDGFDGGAASKFSDTMHSVGDNLEPLKGVGKVIADFFSGLGSLIAKAGPIVADNLQMIGDKIANTFGPNSFDHVLSIIRTALLGGIFLIIKKFFKSGMKIDLTGGVFDKIKETLGQTTSTLRTMQQNLKADILMRIALAIGTLAAALWVLSTIPDKKLRKAMVGMTIGLGALTGVMYVLAKYIEAIFKLPFIAAAMVLLAGAILILAFALKVMASINWDDLSKGLLATAALLGMLVGTMIILSKYSKSMIGAGLGILAISVALKILASVMKDFAEMKWKEIGKGLAAVAATLVVLAFAMMLMPKGLIFTGTGLMMVGIGLMAISHAVENFGKMSIMDIAKGIGAMAVTLGLLAIAMGLFPPTMALTGAGLILVGIGLSGIAHAIEKMGGMSLGTMAKGMIALALSLTILAIGLNAIGLTGLAGAAALFVTAAALAIFAPALAILGKMSWESIIKGLVALAAVFVILGVAGYLLAPVIPIILGLAAALFIIGAAMLLAGAGIMLMATGIAIIVASGSAGMAVLVGGLKAVINLIPLVAKKLAEGAIIWVLTLANGAGKLVGAMSKIFNKMLDAVIKSMPKIRQAMSAFVAAMLGILIDNIPRIVTAGMKLVLALLRGVDQNIGKITSRAISISIKFLNAFGKRIPAMIQAGVNFIIRFLNGLSRAIDNNSDRVGRAAGRLGVSLVRGMIKGVAGMQSELFGAVAHMASEALHAAMNIFDSHSPSREFEKIGKYGVMGLILGFTKNADQASKASGDMAQGAVDSARGAISRISDALSTEMDTDITIAPVLDLTQLVKDANSMSSLITPPTITAQVTYDAAQGIALQREDAEAAQAGTDEGSGNTYVDLTQINNSPKALDTVEIYRKTKNQISTAKEALKV